MARILLDYLCCPRHDIFVIVVVWLCGCVLSKYIVSRNSGGDNYKEPKKEISLQKGKRKSILTVQAEPWDIGLSECREAMYTKGGY